MPLQCLQPPVDVLPERFVHPGTTARARGVGAALTVLAKEVGALGERGRGPEKDLRYRTYHCQWRLTVLDHRRRSM